MTDILGKKQEFMDSLDGANYDGQSRQEERVHGKSRLKPTMTDSFGRKKEFMDSLDGAKYEGQYRQEARVHGQSRQSQL